MKKELLSLGETGKFSPIFLDYLQQESKLDAFYERFPELDQFEAQIKNKNFSKAKRDTLCKVLKEQYADVPHYEQLTKNLELLQKENTYTITTGHQLNIFTGPLYYIYKIVTIINTCKVLKEKYPTYHFVPVYWMASEDHDFEEISTFNLFGKKFSWSTDQRGAVGRFSPNSIQSLLEELPEIPELFRKAYLENDTLADAVRFYVNELFGNEGLIILDADHRDLKSEFKDVIREDICSNTPQTLVEASSIGLSDKGYKSQVFPREINFFYLKNNIRERIVKEENGFTVLNTSLSFSKDEILELLEKEPECFSPNVVMRPLYQETILPNLAYVGGPAEVAYWLQLKTTFTHFKRAFPMLMPRNFALVINKTIFKKINKLDLPTKDLFLEIDKWKQKFIED
ncbi:bacillithiol biosynthesis cysteine-adding enzyme BshC, partial [Xanthovirga aplysinae]|uniref:bacillithiol biosynthesis cysteine-adding enzyme BshC n=1 Tax=Xanthovirga aplysinae TaxID=2529853 RepID=UPI0012BD224B